MKISAIHIYQHDLPVNGPAYKMALSTVTELDTTIVEIVTDTGLSGFGETCPLGSSYQPAHASGGRAAIAEIAPHLIGMNPLEINSLSHKMDLALNGHLYGKAAIDIALWDLAGKAFNQPVSTLLGGALQDKVPSYYAVSVDEPDEVARIVKAKQDEGYQRLQLKVGGRNIERDIAVVRKTFEVRNQEVSIVLDANRSLTIKGATLLSNATRDLPLVLEQPCNTYDEIKALKGKICHPVYLDENIEDIGVLQKSISEGVADGFGMKITRVGGLSAMRTVRDICHVAGRPITCDDSWGGDIIAAACVHLGSTVHPKLFDGTWIAEPYITGHYDPVNGITVKDGWVDVPNKPGLGIDPEKSVWKEVQSFG